VSVVAPGKEGRRSEGSITLRWRPLDYDTRKQGGTHEKKKLGSDAPQLSWGKKRKKDTQCDRGGGTKKKNDDIRLL